jgi:hypothetical protein
VAKYFSSSSRFTTNKLDAASEKVFKLSPLRAKDVLEMSRKEDIRQAKPGKRCVVSPTPSRAAPIAVTAIGSAFFIAAAYGINGLKTKKGQANKQDASH